MSIADKYILADGSVPPAVPNVIEMPAARQRWTAEDKALFHELAPVAFYVAGPAGPVSVFLHDAATGAVTRRFGGNYGFWPIVTGTSKAVPWMASVSTTYNTRSPCWPAGLLFRLWLPNDDYARRFEEAATALMRERDYEADLNGRWLGLSPWTDMTLLEFELAGMRDAWSMQSIRSDAELHEDCRRMAERRRGAADHRAELVPAHMRGRR